MIINEDIILLDGLPYVYIKSIDTIVCADFHLGYEVVLADEEGYFLPQAQFHEILDELKRITKQFRAKEIVIVGDLKHKFSRRTRQETREVLKILEFINQNFDKGILVRGNHDNFIRGLFNRYENIDFIDRYYIEGRYLFTHGHILDEDIEKEAVNKTLVIGHEHPALLLYDDIGGKIKIPTFLYGDTTLNGKILVLPAVSPLMSGIEVNLISESEFLSPIIRKYVNVDLLKPYGILRGKEILEFPPLRLWRGIPERTRFS
ncbi:MAG: metallophosphoesterase [Candidatus Njordarchaeia archaeon]|nr:metallophosphoesterase [Candidatus Korarchaeota archaeon]